MAKAAREEFEGAKQLRQLENDYNALVPLVAWAEIAQQERQAARADQAASVSLNAQAEAQQQVEKLEQEKARRRRCCRESSRAKRHPSWTPHG